MEVGLDPVHIVLDGDTAPLPKKATEPPTIGPSLLWPNGWMHQHMPLGMEVRLSPCDFVLDGDPAPYLRRGGAHPIFDPNGCIDQDSTWYGGRPQPARHCVRCADPATTRKKGTPTPPNFLAHVYCGQMAGWMNYEDAAWYGSRPRPRPHCTRRGPSSRERATAAPLFSARVYCGHSRPSQLLLSSCNVVERWLSAELCKLSLQTKHQKIDVFVNVKYSRIAEDGTNLIFRRPFINGSPYPNRPLSVCNVGALWPNRRMDQDENWHAGSPRP